MGHGWGQGWVGPGWSGSEGFSGHQGKGPGGRGRPGPPPWVQELVRSFGGPDMGGQRGAKVRRGDVRAAILDVLAVEPMNGYQIIQQISERSGGVWKPSPGSVYPTVQQLEDEGLIEGQEAEGRRVLVLTDAGRTYVAEHPDELAATWRPFEATGPEVAAANGVGDLKPVIGQVMGAVWQIMVSGTDQQRAEAADVLGETRRRLYGLLAEGEPE
ncbi:Transcriptional regulator, PadR-like family [metagenome]|uniref:Transcriptional regulator, PadR-like family n=1 Tax=metagenome TaxID=256318 RepID=A0A2P2BWV9_9ZZZZ